MKTYAIYFDGHYMGWECGTTIDEAIAQYASENGFSDGDAGLLTAVFWQ